MCFSREVGDAINQLTNEAEDAWDDINGRSPFEKFIRKLGRAGIALGIKPEAFVVIVFVLALIFVALLLKCCCCSSSKQRPTIIYAQPPYNNFK